MKRSMRGALALSAAAAALLAAAPSFAQTSTEKASTPASPASSDATAAPDSTILGEVTVTARKRDETLQQTPIAIQAFTAADLKSARIERLADISKLTPGLNYTPLFGAQNQLPIIRGAAQTFGQLNVGVFLDGVYLSGKAGVDLELNDLERVEVVKGPQSALYGRNTFAGAINYITKRPSSEQHGQLELTGGENGLVKAIASIEGPISDTLRFRLGLTDRHFDGFYKSAIDGGRVDFSDTQGFSGTLEWQPTQRFRATLRASLSNEDSGQPPSNLQRTNSDLATPSGGSASQPRFLIYRGEVAPIPDNGVLVNTRTSGYERSSYGQRVENVRGSMELRYDFDWATLTSMSAYAHRTSLYQFDGDNTVCDRTGGCPSFGFPFAPAIANGASNFSLSSSDESFRDVSQELRLSSPANQRLQWLIGGFYYNNKTSGVGESLSSANSLTGATAAFYGFPRVTTSTESLSVFGSLGYRFTDQLTATVELRHEDEHQTYRQAPTNPACSGSTDASCQTFNQPAVVTNALRFSLPKLDFDFTTPRVIVDYKITPTNMVYASFAQGVKTGGFNSATNIQPTQRTYTPEESYNYEIGTKNQFFNRRVLANAAFYYTDWYKQQIACQEPGTASSTNRTYVCTAGAASVYGIELEGAWRVTDNITLSGNYAYTNATYDKFLDPTLAATIAALGLPAIDFNGKNLPYVPEHKLVFIPRYNRPAVWRDFDLEVRADVAYQTKSYVRADNFAFFGDKATVDLRLTLQNANWRFQAFVDNVFDNDTPVAAVRFFDSVNYFVAAPLITGADRRQAGVTLGYRF